MTPACRKLKKLKIDFSIHEYEHDPSNTNFGLEASQKLNLDPASVFKTLLVASDKETFVAIIPVSHTLNLKKAAAAFQAKKVTMANPKDAERLTGYILGGISPIGQKKTLVTCIDASAKALDKIYVSGGKRGLDIGLAPSDLLNACHQSTFVELID